MTTFNAGDKVRNTSSGAECTVQAGPFEGSAVFYVVRMSDGTETPMGAASMEPVPAVPVFKVGDRVSHHNYGEGTIVYGPATFLRDDCYILETEARAYTVVPQSLTLVHAADPTHLRDRVGDIWEVNSDGTWTMTRYSDGEVALEPLLFRAWSLERVKQEHGPVTLM